MSENTFICQALNELAVFTAHVTFFVFVLRHSISKHHDCCTELWSFYPDVDHKVSVWVLLFGRFVIVLGMLHILRTSIYLLTWWMYQLILYCCVCNTCLLLYIRLNAHCKSQNLYVHLCSSNSTLLKSLVSRIIPILLMIVLMSRWSQWLDSQIFMQIMKLSRFAWKFLKSRMWPGNMLKMMKLCLRFYIADHARKNSICSFC